MTTLTSPRHAAVESDRHLPALDGVRALAVAAVVTYHLGASWLPGGFLGVDLFFVLSGFLITGILLDEVHRRGTISWPTFAARRARRLLPALYLVLLAVSAWALLVAAPDEIGDLRGAGLAALFYVANWFFILTGQSYFADLQGPSPLEHTWSLAIEEQYYLLWPLLLLLLLRRSGWRGLTVVTALLAAASVALMAITFDEADPSVAYFGTFSRVHEIFIGSLLAIAMRHGVRLPARWRWTSWAALLGVVAMMATTSDVGDFYYRGGSVVFSLLVAWLLLGLASGPSSTGPGSLFSWRPLVWIGLISYGIYLWHWPLILWLTPVRTGLDGLPLAGVRIGATVAIAAASFYLVERPIRRGRIRGFALTPRRLAVIVPAAMVVMAVIIIGSTSRALPPSAELEVTAAPTSLTGSTQSGAPVVAIAGDSIPKELMPDLEREAAARDWGVLPLAFGGCSVTGTYQVNTDGRPFTWSKRCSQGFRALQSEAIRTYDPDVILWYSNRERYPVRAKGKVLQPGTAEHRAQLDRDLQRTYRRLTAGGADLVIVLPVPKAPPIRGTCAAGPDAAPECRMDDAYYATFDDLADAYRMLAAKHPDRVSIVEIDDLLCPGGRDCPLLERDGAAVRPDGIHFSPEGAAWFIPQLFDRAGLTDRREDG